MPVLSPELVARKPFGNRHVEVVVHHRTIPNPVAALAIALLERWGPVMAAPDGEDSAGRAQLRPMTAAETVERAADIAESAYDEFDRRGWLDQAPSYQELADQAHDGLDDKD